jgi:hypothetical protein
MTIPKPFNIDGNDGPVNGRAPILHLLSPREQGKQVLVLTEHIFDFTVKSTQVRTDDQCR